MPIDHSSFGKAVHDQRTDVGTTTNGRRVAQGLCCFFDRGHQESLASMSVSVEFRLHARQSAGANQSRRPGAEILGAEIPAHDFLDVDIDITSFHIDKRVVTVLVLEHVTARSSQKFSDNPSGGLVAKLAVLADAGLAGKIKYDQVAPDPYLLRSQRGEPVASVF